MYAAAFPIGARGMSPAAFKIGIKELVGVDCVRFYESGGQTYVYVPSWDKHQKRRAKVSRFPDPPEPHASACDQMLANVPVVVVGDVIGIGSGIGDEKGVLPPSAREQHETQDTRPAAPPQDPHGSSPPEGPAPALPASNSAGTAAAAQSARFSRPDPPALPPASPGELDCSDCSTLLRTLHAAGIVFGSLGPRLSAWVHEAHTVAGLERALAAIAVQVRTCLAKPGMRRFLAPGHLFEPGRWAISLNAAGDGRKPLTSAQILGEF